MYRANLPRFGAAAIVLLLLLSDTLWSFSAESTGIPPLRVDLCRFTPVNYQLTAANAAVINQVVGELLQRHEEAFGFKADKDFHVPIRIFGRQEEYLAFARTNHSASGEPGGINASNLAGYYSGRDGEVITWRQRDPSYLANNILHECSHAIMHAHYERLPTWLSEGCAVYFSFPLHLQDASDVQNLKHRWALLARAQQTGTLPELRSFLNLTPQEFHATEQNLAYAASWSLFQLLMSTPENRRVLNKVLDILQDSDQAKPDVAGILGGSYPGGLAKFERDWQAWIRKGAANFSPPPKPTR